MTSVSTPFIIPDEGKSKAGAEGELERRKFTAEEGDHLTLLNVYNAFINPRAGKKSSKWCSQHRLNFKALSRAVSIRGQLEKYARRFNVVLESCEGDSSRLRKCLTSGYFKNAAKFMADGTYRSVRENAVSTLEYRMKKQSFGSFSELTSSPSLHRSFMFIPRRSCSTGIHRRNGSSTTR